MAALGGATAEGLPTVLPQVSSYFEEWIPRNKYTLGSPDIGAVIYPGDAAITGLTLKIDDVVQTGVVQTPDGEFLRIVKTAAGPFGVGSTHTVELSYNDSVSGLKTFTRTFEVAVFIEDFDGVVLGPNVTEDVGNPRDAVWTDEPFNGWTIDDSQMQGSVDDPALGMEEWEGWAVADYAWWATVAGDQRRFEFGKARGNVAVADPDEWDDRGNAKGTYGYFNSFMNSPAIDLTGLAANSVGLSFDSSWRPEAFDDAGPDGLSSNNQTAVITVSYDGGAPIEVLRWDSDPTSAFYKDDNSVNDSVAILLNNPEGATSMALSFALLNSGNDWWWAVDNIAVTAGAVAPFVTTQPGNVEVAEGGDAVFTVTATGTQPFEYKWFKQDGTDEVEILDATTDTLTLNGVTVADAGRYFVRIMNAGGTTDSSDAFLVVQLAPASMVLFTEDFNSLALGPNVDEALARDNVWTKTGPAGWTIDDSAVPGAGTANDGVTEWAGWSFADRAWWAETAGNQRRAEFTKGTGAVAIADGDEWDDQPREAGQMTTYLSTPAIGIDGREPNTLVLRFDSSWLSAWSRTEIWSWSGRATRRSRAPRPWAAPGRAKRRRPHRSP